MAVERRARKEERCGDVLNALVRNDQGLKNIALALCKPKGGDEGVEALIGRELRCLHERGVGTCGRKISTKIVGSKRQPVLHHGIIGSLPQLSQQRNRNAHKHHERRTDRSQHVLIEIIATAGAVTNIEHTLSTTRPMHGQKYDQRA